MKYVVLALLLAFPALSPAQDASPEKGPKEPSEKRTEKRLRMADELQAQGDADGALEILEDLSKREPKNVELLRRIVALQLRTEKFKEATANLEKLLELEGGTAEEYGALARMMIESDQNEVAASFLEDAAKKFPESADFPFLLTFALGRLERWPEAITQFEKTVDLADDDSDLLDESFYFRYAAALERDGDFDQSVEILRKTLELIEVSDPDNENPEFTATVLNYLAYLWIERGENLDEAGKMARDAIKLSPGSGAIADTLGWFHFQKGDYPRALSELKKAERLIEEPDPVILDHLGQTLAKLNEKEFAADYFRKALELDPKNADLKARLEEVAK